jgi:hypothetical protein
LGASDSVIIIRRRPSSANLLNKKKPEPKKKVPVKAVKKTFTNMVTSFDSGAVPLTRKQIKAAEFKEKIVASQKIFPNVAQGSLYTAHIHGGWILRIAEKGFDDTTKCHTGFFNLAIAVCLNKGKDHVRGHLFGPDDKLSFYDYLIKFGERKKDVSSTKISKDQTNPSEESSAHSKDE